MPKFRLIVAAAVCIACLGGALAATAIAQSQRFNDVPTDHYAYDSINWAVEIGVTQGCGDGTDFCPDDNLNRAHMVTFLQRYHDWLTGPPTASPAPPRYATYEAAVTAANDWYDQMEAIIGGGSRTADWQEVIPLAAEKAAAWAGNDLLADRIRNEALVMSRTGDPNISDRLNDIAEARFYLSAISYSLAAGASQAAQASGVSESDAASAAAWSAVGARLATLAEPGEFRCGSCVIGGYDRFPNDNTQGRSSNSTHEFDWEHPARFHAGEARNAYFELAS